MAKRYVFKLVVDEGNDEFWESLGLKSGCDEVEDLLVRALDNFFPEMEGLQLMLVNYENSQ